MAPGPSDQPGAEAASHVRRHHPRTEHRAGKGGKLGLREAISMAIGGMIGGGIFSVLGLTIALAGHLAFVSFLLGAVIAGLTAHAFARLADRSRRSGGPFTYLRDAGHPRAGAWIAWLLIVGYVFALVVYAFTFGHYLANAIGAPPAVARAGSGAVLLAFVAINLRGVVTSGLIEDVVVFTKLAILGGVAAVGLAAFSPGRLEPLDNEGILGVLLGAGVIFVAYEGFELLPYDYEDIDRPRRNLPLALYTSVAAVAAIYGIVTIGSQMLLEDADARVGLRARIRLKRGAGRGPATLAASPQRAALPHGARQTPPDRTRSGRHRIRQLGPGRSRSQMMPLRGGCEEHLARYCNERRSGVCIAISCAAGMHT